MFDTNKTAVFYGGGPDEPTHRVWLRRKLNDGDFKPFVMILHNPSIAAEIKNDPTATRGIGFAIRAGCSDLIFVNAATAIATDANKLHHDILNCPWSDWALREAARMATEHGGHLVAGWGAPKGRAEVKRRMAARFTQIRGMGLPLEVLRLTASGHPEHPLYLPSELTPRRWEP